MIIKWGLQPFNLQLNFWILLCFSWLVYTDMVMADMNCSCFWPNSHNHASQHTDGNTTVSKTHSRLFKKSTTYVLQCQEWKTMLATYGSFFFFPSLFVLALESQSESQLHRPLNSISHETYSTFLLFVFSVRTHVALTSQCLIVGLYAAVVLTDSRAVVWHWTGLFLRPALSLPFCFFSFLFHSTYFYHSYSWPPSGNDM